MKQLTSAILNTLSRAALSSAFNKGYPVPLNLGNRIKGTPLATNNRSRRRSGLERKERRRRTGGNTNAGIEINKAEGGFKSVTSKTSIRQLVVNTYGRIIASYDSSLNGFVYKFQLARTGYNANTDAIDVKNELTLSAEFRDWMAASLEYKVHSICFSFDYNRIPKSGETLPKLFLWTNTDKIQIINPQLESNVMILGMQTNGIKNYNTRPNLANTIEDNLQWIRANSDWPARWELKISAQDLAFLDRTNQETYYVLGTWKLSINLDLRLQDSITGLNKIRETPELNRLITNSKVSQLEGRIEELQKKIELLMVSKDNDGMLNEEDIKDRKKIIEVEKSNEKLQTNSKTSLNEKREQQTLPNALDDEDP